MKNLLDFFHSHASNNLFCFRKTTTFSSCYYYFFNLCSFWVPFRYNRFRVIKAIRDVNVDNVLKFAGMHLTNRSRRVNPHYFIDVRQCVRRKTRHILDQYPFWSAIAVFGKNFVILSQNVETSQAAVTRRLSLVLFLFYIFFYLKSSRYSIIFCSNIFSCCFFHAGAINNLIVWRYYRYLFIFSEH